MAAVHLSFVERKALLKRYWKYENIKEVQRQCQREFGTPPPTCRTRTIVHIREKFKANGTVKDVHKGRSGRTRTATSPASNAAVLLTWSPHLNVRWFLVYWFLRWSDKILQHRSTGCWTCSCSCSTRFSLVNNFNSFVAFKFVAIVDNIVRHVGGSVPNCLCHCHCTSFMFSYFQYHFSKTLRSTNDKWTKAIVATQLSDAVVHSTIEQSYVTTHSPTFPSLYLCHSSFSNPSVTSPTSQFVL